MFKIGDTIKSIDNYCKIEKATVTKIFIRGNESYVEFLLLKIDGIDCSKSKYPSYYKMLESKFDYYDYSENFILKDK